MSSFLIIDGYNLINKWLPLLKAKQYSIESARDKLFYMLQAYCDFKDIKGIIVYDGSQSKRSVEDGNPTVIYSKKGESADTVIESLVYKSKDRENIRLITDDRIVTNMVTGMGAYASSAKVFELHVQSALSSMRGLIREKARKLNKGIRLLVLSGILASFFLTTHASAQTDIKRRIISLTPTSTEILFALGLDKEIVGVSTFCNWPENRS